MSGRFVKASHPFQNKKAGGFQVGIGYFKLKGTGDIHCADIHGETQSRKVRITIGGHPLAARFGIGYLNVYGITGSFGLNGSIEDLYGQYAMVGTGAAVGLGAGGSVMLQNPINGLNLSVNLSGVTGLGVEAGLSSFTIEAI